MKTGSILPSLTGKATAKENKPSRRPVPSEFRATALAPLFQTAPVS
jgi:hypothetical protein